MTSREELVETLSKIKKTEPKIGFNILESGDISISKTSTSGPSSKQIGMANKSDVNKLFSDGKITEEQKNTALEAIKNRPKAKMKQIAPDSNNKITPRMRYFSPETNKTKYHGGGDTNKPPKGKNKKPNLAIMVAVGVPKKKPKMMSGGTAYGKEHMYAAGGSVQDTRKKK